MKTVYLVQRLNKPHGHEDPFAFGGGLKNGGLSKEAFNLLRSIMSFDYMGSAEFEWGAVPTAIKELFSKPNISFEIECLKKPVYIICPPSIKDDLITWLHKASEDEQDRLKESLNFNAALNGELYARAIGWLNIEEREYCEEPFMFFIDKDMFEGVKKLFGIS